MTYDPEYRTYNLLLWNYANTPVDVDVAIAGLPGRYVAQRRLLDAVAPSNDENVRLRPMGPIHLTPEAASARTSLEPYAIQFWSIEESSR